MEKNTVYGILIGDVVLRHRFLYDRYNITKTSHMNMLCTAHKMGYIQYFVYAFIPKTFDAGAIEKGIWQSKITKMKTYIENIRISILWEVSNIYG